MTTIDDVRARFPAKERKLWEIDRILIAEPDGAGGSRFAIDMRAGYSATNRNMGAGTLRLSRKVYVTDALVAMDAYLEGVDIRRLDVWGAQLKNADLERLLATRFIGGVRELELGSNRLTKKGVEALAKHALGAELRILGLAYNKLGNALAKIHFPQLKALWLDYCGIDDKALPNLGQAPLPALRRLALSASALHSTTEKLIRANRMGDEIPLAAYAPSALAAFAKSPLAAQLEQLILGYQKLDKAHAKVLAGHFEALERLDLGDAQMSAAAVETLASGDGFGALKELVLSRTFAPNYSGRGSLNAPAAGTAKAMAALGKAKFAGTLERLALDGVALGPEGAKALFDGELSALRRVELANTQLGDAGLAAIAGSGTSATELILKGNGIGIEGVRALAESPLAQTVFTLALPFNPLGDAGLTQLGTSELPALRRLSAAGANVTDEGARGLAAGSLVQQLEVLVLSDNRISDEGARALAETANRKIERLTLSKNCLTHAGIEALKAAFPKAKLYTSGQDPSKLPPTVLGAPAPMRFVEAADAQKFKPVVPPELRKRYPYPTFMGTQREPSNWVVVMPKEDGKYLVNAHDVDADRAVVTEPPIKSGLPASAFSRDGRWMSVKAFMDGAYVVDLETGSSTRLGDVLTHQKGGSNFCDGRVVILDCDTDGEWEGRLDVYGRGDDGQWRREHSVGGFWKARDEIISLAGDRLLAIKGSQGLFFCAVRGDQLRYLGQLPIPYAEAFDDQQGRTIVRVHNRYSYHLTNLDEVLDAAFARGESPTSFDLPESAWK